MPEDTPGFLAIVFLGFPRCIFQPCCAQYMPPWAKIVSPFFLTQPMPLNPTIGQQKMEKVHKFSRSSLCPYIRRTWWLEGLAESIGISTTYISQTPAARDKRNKKANAARRRKNAVDNDAQGPPDHTSDFKGLSRKRKATDDSSLPDKKVCISIYNFTSYLLRNCSELNFWLIPIFVSLHHPLCHYIMSSLLTTSF